MRRPLLFRLAGLLAAAGLACCAAAAPVRVGVSQFAEGSINFPAIGATVKVIERTLGAENVFVRTYSVAGLQQAAKQGDVDIILSSAGTYRRLLLEGAGVAPMATLASERAFNPNYADGSVFFTLAGNEEINAIEDLRGRVVAANHRYAFSGWQTALGELMERGLPTEGFFKAVDFQGHDMRLVVMKVISGEVDAGIVRACFLEDIGLGLQRFKILGRKRGEKQIDCVHSTRLYPNWTASALPSLDPESTRLVTAALLSMPPLEHNLHWSVANDFRAIDSLFLSLKIGPYEHLQRFDFGRFLARYWPGFAIALVLIACLLLHGITVERLVAKRTLQLRYALERERQLQEDARLAQEHLSSVQRAGIIGQMSSMIAHELRQPLSSISMYCFGLLRRKEDAN
ncbi:MAG: PhnD/SsuA/transferrin family substrate-binding protein, partial [Duodenibacillus sp.]|nr:PhnD/SsuA/transferrin family substrate-binding protein [Duodenibacillus sp.]